MTDTVLVLRYDKTKGQLPRRAVCRLALRDLLKQVEERGQDLFQYTQKMLEELKLVGEKYTSSLHPLHTMFSQESTCQKGGFFIKMVVAYLEGESRLEELEGFLRKELKLR